MKNQSQRTRTFNRFVSIIDYFVFLSPLLAASVLVFASAEIDRQYALDSVGVLRPWDNIDGLFAEYLRDAYKEYFSTQSRFRLQDISKTDPLLMESKLPYAKLIEDPEILQQVARSSRVESLIRTKVYKEGRKYRVALDWIHAAKMDVLGTDEFFIQDPEPGQSLEPMDMKSALHHSVDRLFAKAPFVGNVTGRDHNWVTVSVSRTISLRKGDQLVITTLEDVKRHPRLKQIVEWRQSETGRLEVDDVDHGVAFARVLEEQPDRQIAPYQKIAKVLPATDQPLVITKNGEVESEIQKKRFEPPKTGWVDGALWLGGMSRERSQLNSTVGQTGGGFLYGAQVSGQLWLNRNFFTDMQIGLGMFGYSQQDIQTGQDSQYGNGGSSTTRFAIDVGYSYLVTGEFWGPKAFAKLGYRRNSFNLPNSSAGGTGSIAWGSMFLGLGGDLPLYDYWGAQLNLDLGLFRSVSQSENSAGSVTGDSDVGFYVGGYYHFAPRIVLKFGLQFDAYGADFDSGVSIAHRIISVRPAIQYYF